MYGPHSRKFVEFNGHGAVIQLRAATKYKHNPGYRSHLQICLVQFRTVGGVAPYERIFFAVPIRIKLTSGLTLSSSSYPLASAPHHPFRQIMCYYPAPPWSARVRLKLVDARSLLFAGSSIATVSFGFSGARWNRYSRFCCRKRPVSIRYNSINRW